MRNAKVTARSRPAPELRVSGARRQLLRLLVEQLPAVIWTTDRRLRFTSSLGRGLAMLGLRPGQVVGLSLFDYFQTDDPRALPIAAHRRALRGRSCSFRAEWNGRVFHAHLEPLRHASGRIAGVVGLALDITELDHAVRERLASEQRYRQLFENALDIVFTLDLAGNFLSLNRAAQRITGYSRSELLGSNIARVLEPEAAHYVHRRIQRALGGETTAEFELPVLTKDGRRIFLEVSARLQFENGRPATIQGIARDITERKRLEEQLLETQKMEAIGELAGGVAHDFNNLLSAILGYTDLLKAQSHPGELVWEAAEVIERAGERARQLTERLLGFARRGKSRNLRVDLHAVLQELIELLEHTFPKNIALQARFEAPQAVVPGDPGQLHQVFLNLLLNARDAMPDGGSIELRSELVELAAETFSSAGVPTPGTYVRVSVRDTGVGIAPEHLPRVFEPFFTTKSERGGTGMGLAMVYGIVKNHGGAIQVRSQLGQGATFTVYLPAAAAPAGMETSPPESPAVGVGSVLVVDDEDMVAQAVVRMLESLGYRATAAGSGHEALERVRAAPQAFDLVILDLMMPSMDGRACFQALKAIRPDLPVLVSSGYAENGAAQQLLDAGAVGFLPKPYPLRQLAQAVEQALKR